MTGIWAFCCAWVALDLGDLDAGLGLAHRAFSDLERFDPFSNLRMARSLVSLAHSQRGEIEAARSWFEAIGSLDDLEPRSRVHADRAEIWVTAASDASRAATLAREAGERAESGTLLTWSTPLYHDAVRLNAPHLAVEPLSRIASETGLPIIELMARHAGAAAAGDVDALQDVGEAYRGLGCSVAAAESFAQATTFLGERDPRRARLQLRGHLLATKCAALRTPLIAGLASPLSSREAEIAEMAARGETSRDISSRLYLSTRTVDNHLSAVYRKLGVTGRDELEGLFL